MTLDLFQLISDHFGLLLLKNLIAHFCMVQFLDGAPEILVVDGLVEGVVGGLRGLEVVPGVALLHLVLVRAPRLQVQVLGYIGEFNVRACVKHIYLFAHFLSFLKYGLSKNFTYEDKCAEFLLELPVSVGLTIILGGLRATETVSVLNYERSVVAIPYDIYFRKMRFPVEVNFRHFGHSH